MTIFKKKMCIRDRSQRADHLWTGMSKTVHSLGVAPNTPSKKGVKPVSYTHLDVYKRQVLYAGGL